MTSTIEEEFELVIIGGGPTGLLCALLARQFGISVSLIDAKQSILEAGRADGLNARTQEYLGVSGTLDSLRPNGIVCNTRTTASSTFANGDFQSRQSDWWTSLEHCLHKNMLIIGQPEVEKTLLAQLKTCRRNYEIPGLAIHFGHHATSIVEDGEGVTVLSEGVNEYGVWSEITTRAQFAIGADGARSMVRPRVGIRFEGTQPQMVWAVLDTFLDTDFPVCPEIISLQLDGQCRVLWIPRERGMARFYIRLLEGETVTQAAAEATIRKHMAPYRVDFLRTEWFSTFEVKERVASEFVSLDGKGRVFLAGDAAHCHSVNGAQGLNTGVADAFGLVWRVAHVIGWMRDGGPDRNAPDHKCSMILKSYNTERRAVAQNAVGVAAQLVRDTRHDARQYVETIEKNAGYITGMGVAYDGLGSPLVVESERGLWKAGRRCPDLAMQLCGTQPPGMELDTCRLYGVARKFYYGLFLLLVIGHQSHAAPDLQQQFSWIANTVTLVCSGAVPSLTVPSKLSGLPYAGDWSFVTDVVGPDDSFIVVVRPDLYIGYVGDKDGLLSYMGTMGFA
ncbi:FAD binding domain containing protein [Apiospora saccharicola]|uniref:FAD binding domain containing protein n=1 Tax=Apiospora saccharicola TaxID=335842 RepID=A0ABR1W3M1_9PEZI